MSVSQAVVTLLLHEVALSVDMLSAMLAATSKGQNCTCVRVHGLGLSLVSRLTDVIESDTDAKTNKGKTCQNFVDGALATRGVLMAIFGRTVRIGVRSPPQGENVHAESSLT